VVVSRASYNWGKDDVVKLTPSFSQPNVMGEWSKAAMGADSGGRFLDAPGGARAIGTWRRFDRSGDSGRVCVPEMDA